jgi:phosphatidylserine/phosphatidylglycerophosphate/cardiolipin synthase-like enzyme
VHGGKAEGQRHRRLQVKLVASTVFAASLALALAAASCGGSSPVAVGGTDPAADAEGGATSSGGDDGGDSTSGGPALNPDGGPPVSGPDNVTIIVEPTDKAQALLSAISGAKTSVRMTMYLLGDKRFVDALIAQHGAGRDVKVILNQKFVNSAGTNQAVYSQLQAAGVPVVWAPSTFSLTHEKCVIVDAKKAWIMTMNLETSSSSNREFLAIDSEAADVAEAEAVFAADFANTAFVPSGNLLVAPVNARDKLLALIQSAKSSVDLEGEELSDYKIVNALVAAQKSGVKVRVVLSDTTPSSAQAMAVQQLKAGNVQVVSLGTPYIHAKAIVADGARAYVGSENFTTGSLQYNRELGLITTNAASAAQVAQTIAKDFASGSAL